MGVRNAETDETIEHCLGKSWIKILTEADCEQDRMRWEADENQYCSEYIYKAGNVDFTPEGGLLYTRIQMRIDAESGRRPHDGWGCAWRFPQQGRFFSAYQDQVIKAAEEMRAEPETFLVGYEESIQIDRIEGLFAIGPWWLNRFVQLPAGYRMDLYYTLLDKNKI